MKPLLFLLFFAAVSPRWNPVTAAQPTPAAENTVPALLAAPSSSTNASAGGASRSSGYVLDDKHRLAPLDKISFRIVEDRDPAVTLPITDSGELEVPYLGRLKVTGKTCKELKEELETLLKQDYYYRATVVIGLDAVSKVRGQVWIWGQVRTQGAIDIPTEDKFTVGKAILRAGGFGEFANKKKVKLSRTLPDGTKQEEVLDMEEIFEKGKTEKDKPLQDGDFIIVPEKVWNL